jgi:ABC-type phosphate/phosphonate transport system substrate-binding protein
LSIAGISMYVAPEPVAEATKAFWHFIRDHLRNAGLPDVPEELDQAVGYRDVWLRPDLLLSQTCGFPYVKTLRDRVRLVATPCYAYPGCDGPSMLSFIVINKNAGISTREALRGRRAAINSHDSNSGYNLFRAAIAPIADGAPFFGDIIETGGHAASITAILEGRADCAAIDCITYGNIARYAPERVADISILAETPSGPGLPFITRASASDRDVEMLRAALGAALAEPRLAGARDRLGLVGFDMLSDRDYDRLQDLERDAMELEYPELA